jgi:hypothetical protein
VVPALGITPEARVSSVQGYPSSDTMYKRERDLEKMFSVGWKKKKKKTRLSIYLPVHTKNSGKSQ